MEQLLLGLFCILATLAAAVVLLPFWIKAARKRGIEGADMNKFDKRMVAEAGGIAPVLAITLGICLLIFIKSFILGTETHLVLIFGLLTTLLLAGFLGFVDDVLGWKKGISQLSKIMLTLPIVLPLVVININHSVINLPFLGSIELGLLYPLLIVPVGIIGATNGFNLIAGYNGVEAGMGLIILGALGFVAYVDGQAWLALVCFIAVSALVGFLLFNFNPAKIFPGDALTYAIGALIAGVAILGSMEKLAAAMFSLYFIEILLKLRSKTKFGGRIDVENFGVPAEDNSLSLKYDKKYSTTHVVLGALKKLKGKVYETDVVLSFWVLQVLISIGALLVFWA